MSSLEEELILTARSYNRFDKIVGTLEEIILEPGFNAMVNKFLTENCNVFETSEENKLIYTDVFNRYTNLVEQFLEENLKARIEDFSMNEFLEELKNRKDEVSQDILELLIVDFEDFKELMLLQKHQENHYVQQSTYSAKPNEYIVKF